MTDNPTKAHRRSLWIKRTAGTALVFGALMLGLNPASSFAADGQNAPAATAADSRTDDGEMGIASKNYGLVVNVTNNSSFDLRWVGGDGDDPSSTPKAILHPGDTDRIEYTGGGYGVQTHPTWQVVGMDKSYLVSPAFGVPLIGNNGYVCTADEVTTGSPVKLSKCDIGVGWDPDAHVTFADQSADLAAARPSPRPVRSKATGGAQQI